MSNLFGLIDNNYARYVKNIILLENLNKILHKYLTKKNLNFTSGK
jgi:hypothetical protein